LLALRAARQGQAPARKAGFPIFPASWSFPQMVPVSNGELFVSRLPGTAQECSADYFRYFIYPHYFHSSEAVFRR
jgi:hypothetical protein